MTTCLKIFCLPSQESRKKKKGLAAYTKALGSQGIKKVAISVKISSRRDGKTYFLSLDFENECLHIVTFVILHSKIAVPACTFRAILPKSKTVFPLSSTSALQIYQKCKNNKFSSFTGHQWLPPPF